jgi:hypothetical protein
MWDATALHVPLSKVGKKVEVRGIPHLAKNERDMGHPTLCGKEKTEWPNRKIAGTPDFIGKREREGNSPPCHSQYKTHRGACGQTRIVP